MSSLLRSLLVLLGFLSCGFAHGQDPPRWTFNPPMASSIDGQYTDVATYTLKVGAIYQLCWNNPNVSDDGTETTALQLAYRRYRVEGGPVEFSAVLQYPDWVPQKDTSGNTIPKAYCTKASGLPKAGHWVMGMRMCRVPYVSDETSCSVWVESIVAQTAELGGGMVDGKPKGWWLYAYLPPPPNVVIE